LIGIEPGAAKGNGTIQRAQDAFRGPDLSGKNGPMVRLGLDLTQLHFEHRNHLVTKPGTAFRSANALVRTRGQDVIIDAVAVNDASALRDELVALGMTDAAVYGRHVSGLLPMRSLPSAASLNELQLARPAAATKRSGAVTSQGDTALGGAAARATYGVNGSGVLVGSLSDSYNCQGGAAGDVGSGDLPSGIIVLAEEPGCSSGSDEGRAMMQIVHDVAPGASQAFHTAFGGIADFASGIVELAAAGATVINDDVAYFAEPMFQDGAIAQAVNQVNASGVAYFSAAGNDARQSYEANFAGANVSGATRHDFNPGGGVDTLQQVTIPARTQIIFVLQWDQPFFSVSGSPGATTDLDMYLYSAQGVAQAGGLDNNIGGDAVEVFAYQNNSGRAKTYQLGIKLEAGPSPSKIKYLYFGDMTVNEYATNSGTVYGHPLANGAIAVGAARYSQTPAYGVSPPQLEYFSSAGGTPILLSESGGATYDLRQKPEVVAPNGGDNTFFGSDYEGNGWPNFFGTSAAAPHAAGVAALMQSLDNNATPADVYTGMQSTATDMGAAGPDFDSGYGLLQASQALNSMLDTLSVTTVILPAGQEEKIYSLYPLEAEGGLPPYTWTKTSGNLPPGILLENSFIGGIPTDNLGSPYTFTVQVTDALGNKATQQLSIQVADCDCTTSGGCHAAGS
jgi:subtilisin family serine protease